jgi:hypothetical protein
VLSWNPNLFPFRLKLHDSWPVSQGPRKDTYFVGENPQFSLLIDRPGAVATAACRNSKAKPSSSASSLTVSVWILLTRHITDTHAEEGDQGPSRIAQGPDDSRVLALHCHRGTKVIDRLVHSVQCNSAFFPVTVSLPSPHVHPPCTHHHDTCTCTLRVDAYTALRPSATSAACTLTIRMCLCASMWNLALSCQSPGTNLGPTRSVTRLCYRN